MTKRADKTLAKLKAKKAPLQAELSQINAREQAIHQRQITVSATAARKLDTKRKIVLGGFVLKKMKADEILKNKMLAELEIDLTSDSDRRAWGFEPILKAPQNEA